MAKAKYIFSRDNQNRRGITSAQEPATDANSALSHWQGEVDDGRHYDPVTEYDVSLTAELSWSDGDTRAGPDLDDSCTKFGVQRE